MSYVSATSTITPLKKPRLKQRGFLRLEYGGSGRERRLRSWRRRDSRSQREGQRAGVEYRAGHMASRLIAPGPIFCFTKAGFYGNSRRFRLSRKARGPEPG